MYARHRRSLDTGTLFVQGQVLRARRSAVDPEAVPETTAADLDRGFLRPSGSARSRLGRMGLVVSARSRRGVPASRALAGGSREAREEELDFRRRVRGLDRRRSRGGPKAAWPPVGGGDRLLSPARDGSGPRRRCGRGARKELLDPRPAGPLAREALEGPREAAARLLVHSHPKPASRFGWPLPGPRREPRMRPEARGRGRPSFVEASVTIQGTGPVQAFRGAPVPGLPSSQATLLRGERWPDLWRDRLHPTGW